MRTRTILAAALLAHALLAQTGTTIEGTVLNSVTGGGVAGVTVRFRTPQGAHYETTTDESGVYRINGVSPGDYDWHFEKTGFGEVEAGFPAPLAPQRLRIAPATNSLHLNHTLAPLSTVRGRVTGLDGTPAANVQVMIAIGPDGVATTNEAGEFVFDKLRPGVYTLKANPPVGSETMVRDGVRVETVATFFPSATDRSEAQAIRVRGGSDQSGFEIRLQSAAVYSIRGMVVDEAGKPVPVAHVTLAGISTNGGYLTGQMTPGSSRSARYLLVGRVPSLESSSFTTKEDGRFEFPSVHSGNWQLRADSERLRDPASRRDFMWTGQASALVARHDLDDIEIRLAPPFARDGIVDWGVLPVPIPERRAYVRLVSIDSGGMAMGVSRPDGTLHFENLPAGRYRIVPMPALTPGYYPASVLLGDREVTGQEVDLNATSPPIRLVMKAGPGSIRGTVENGAGATVLLTPQTATDPDALLAIPCGPDGAFQIPGLPPGDYSVAAFDRVGTEQGSSVPISSVLSAATRVRVDEGATATAQLQLNRWPE